MLSSWIHHLATRSRVFRFTLTVQVLCSEMSDPKPEGEQPTDKDVEAIYDIALDPTSLDRFISAWHGEVPDDPEERINRLQVMDRTLRAHIDRASLFLDRAVEDGRFSVEEILEPFRSLAALVLDKSLTVIACNAGAATALDVEEGCTLDAMPLAKVSADQLGDALRDLLESSAASERLLMIEAGEDRRTILVHIRRLSQPDEDGHPMILVVATLYSWPTALDKTLGDAFGLTVAERTVLRALCEGSTVRAIAAGRSTSDGTVRNQVKTIFAKMNVGSQAEAVRLVLSLRDMIDSVRHTAPAASAVTEPITSNFLDKELWKDFRTVTLPDGRRMDYHDQGPITGAPVLYSHMGYALVRWTMPMLKLAFRYNLRIICPIRAGYGQSDNLRWDADVLRATREDTLFLCDRLGLGRLPYLTQGNDLIFAADFAAHYPGRISEIIGLCARPYLPDGKLYSGMSKWHRFFLSSALYAPHLLDFTSKAAVAMARRIGALNMFRRMNHGSAADMQLLEDGDTLAILTANAGLLAGDAANVAQAYAMEILQTESDWSDRLLAARETPTRSINGMEDPALASDTLGHIREAYPWIAFELVEDAGQLLIYQHFGDVIPKVAKAAHQALVNERG